jgi:hypothetical protein
MKLIKNCNALYVSIGVAILNVVLYFQIRKRFLEAKGLAASIYHLVKLQLIFAYIVLPIISILAVYMMCRRGYSQAAYAPALLLNGVAYSLTTDLIDKIREVV